MEEMVTKKEQIAEALRMTQLMLTKHSDKYALTHLNIQITYCITEC